MTVKDIIIVLKLAGFFILGYAVSGGFVFWTAGLIVLHTDEMVQWVYDLGPDYFGWTGLALVMGAFFILIFAWYFGYWLIWKLIDSSIGWKDLRERLPKLFNR